MNNQLFLMCLLFSTMTMADSQWSEPVGEVIGTPNYNFGLEPLYDEPPPKIPETWTELNEAPGYMGVLFSETTTVSGTRFYSYGQAYKVNHITKYKVLGLPQGLSSDDDNNWIEIVPEQNATGSLPGWETVIFPEALLVDGIKVYHTQVSFGYAPRVGEMQFQTVSDTKPIADIKANDADGPINITQQATLLVTVQLDAGDHIGDNADWWVVAATPWGHWYYYTYPNQWVDTGLALNGLFPAYQGPLFTLEPLEVLAITDLPSGDYALYFGVDTEMNGSLDFDKLYYDAVKVKVQ